MAWQITDLRSLAKDIANITRTLYNTYIITWNSENSNRFDKVIRRYRLMISENFPINHNLNACIKNIPPCFLDSYSGYWEEIINKSNRYFSRIKDHKRFRAEEIYIRELITSIKYFLYKMSNYHHLQGKYFMEEDANFNLLVVLITIYSLRDNFIMWINLLNNYSKIPSNAELFTLDNIAHDIFNRCIEQDLQEVDILFKPDYKESIEYKWFNNVYKCLYYIAYFWYTIKQLPSLNAEIDSIVNFINMSAKLQTDEYFRNSCEFVQLLKEKDITVQSINNLLDNSKDFNLKISYREHYGKILNSLQVLIDDRFKNYNPIPGLKIVPQVSISAESLELLTPRTRAKRSASVPPPAANF